MFYRDKDSQLTIAEIEKYIEVFKSTQLPRLQKLERYYKAKNDAIMNRVFSDSTKPNAKIASPYASYIVDNMASYFIAKQVIINSENETMLKEFSDIFNYNDSQSNDVSIARDMGIYGYGIEMYYIDNDKKIRFTSISPQSVIAIFSNTLEKELLYVIRWYESKDIVSEEVTTNIEVYDSTNINYYKSNKDGIIPTKTAEHNFKDVPFSIYQNNDLFEGDFEKVISLIDSYDFAVSDTSNSISYFNDAYLCFINAEQPEDLTSMKENRMLFLSSTDGTQTPDVKWLLKNGDNLEMENYKKRLVQEIHKQSRVPDLNEDGMKSHVSAEAIRMSLLQTEQVVAIKESKFKKGIQRRVELITTILNILGSDYDYREISFTFNRNIPQSYISWADIISKLRGIVSTETLLEQLPFVNNIPQELERLRLQDEINSYSSLGDDDIE